MVERVFFATKKMKKKNQYRKNFFVTNQTKNKNLTSKNYVLLNNWNILFV